MPASARRRAACETRRAARHRRYPGARIETNSPFDGSGCVRPAFGPADASSEGGWTLLLMCVTKLRVGVIFGGRSGEHEVSIASAASIFKHLDRRRYEPVPIRIEKDGRWALGGRIPTAISAGEVLKQG